MRARLVFMLIAALGLAGPAFAEAVRIKDLGRFQGARDNALVGYGVVTGLAGSGDSPRNEVTQQALRSVLSRFGAAVTPDQVRSRNVAAVMVMATLPPSADPGDRIDVTVTSIGDARSLLGGSLLLTPLRAVDQQVYALAQGALVVGGYRFDANFNTEQKNHPTSARVPNGATVEAAVRSDLVRGGAELTFILNNPDVTTAERVAEGVNAALNGRVARVQDARTICIATQGADVYQLISRIEGVSIRPDGAARVVVNEASGTVVAGGGVQISSVMVSQGDIRVSVSVENEGSQPLLYGGYAPEARSLVITNTRLQVSSPRRDAVVRFPNTTVADLVEGLSRANVRTREMIAILQAIKTAGALHADLIVQ